MTLPNIQHEALGCKLLFLIPSLRDFENKLCSLHNSTIKAVAKVKYPLSLLVFYVYDLGGNSKTREVIEDKQFIK